MHDGAPVSVSGALLLGLQVRVVMEPAGRPFRESFSPFWPEQDGAARFQEACDEWRSVVVRGLEMCESQGMLKCPATRCAALTVLRREGYRPLGDKTIMEDRSSVFSTGKVRAA